PAGLAAGLLRTARPRQWVKNLLVFAAPGAAGVLLHASVLRRSALAFVIFCVAASGTYFLNDAADAESDRRHPAKRSRPVAAGAVPRARAGTVAALLLGAALVASPLALGRGFAICVTIYVAINLAYSFGGKREPVLDLVAVASGFLIRAVAGGMAVRVPLSDWFLIVAAFGSLLVVAGKREADLTQAPSPGAVGNGGPAPAAYTRAYLRFVRFLAAAVTITAYCLWAFAKARTGTTELLFELSIVPFVMAILRYNLLVENGRGGAPEEVLLGDWRTLAMGAAWLALFAAAVHGR
ncbi:MAG TPA: decaprenyl-phosphate phosphoribosyltransferase, partial [Actinomycetota bacterium]|nr:decaprenyl-phosphate phosphoribosyltransferase [Actinomycetota bacterium]